MSTCLTAPATHLLDKHIALEAARLLYENLERRKVPILRTPNVNASEPIQLNVDVEFDSYDLRLSLEQFSDRFLWLTMRRLERQISDRAWPGLSVSFRPLPVPSGIDFAANGQFGHVSVRVIRAYDINRDTFPTRIDVEICVSSEKSNA